jgi:hypothetical protein
MAIKRSYKRSSVSCVPWPVFILMAFALGLPGVVRAQGAIITYAGSDALFAGAGLPAPSAQLVGPHGTAAAMKRAGNPAAPSNAAATAATSVEMILNGNFENGLKYWQSNSYATGAVGAAVASTTNPIDASAPAELTVSQSTGTAWQQQFLQPFNMTQGRSYTLSFKA